MSRPSWRFILAAALGIFAVLAYLPFLNGDTRTNLVLLDAPLAKQISAFILYQEGDLFPLAFRRNRDSWELSIDQELYVPARSSLVESFLSELSTKRSGRALEVSNPKNYGFTLTGSYVLDFGEHGSISIGNTSADGADVIVLDRRGKIYRIKDTLSPFMDTRTALWADLEPWKDWVDKQPTHGWIRKAEGGGGAITVAEAQVEELHRLFTGLRCVDITNLPAEPAYFVRIEYGDLSVIEAEIAELPESYGLLTVKELGTSYVLSPLVLDQVRTVLR